MSAKKQLDGLLTLWFAPQTQSLWFHSSKEFDQFLQAKYESLYLQAKSRQLNEFFDNDHLALALVILLDQIPLNIYRNDGKRYATEKQALQIARKIISRGGDRDFSAMEKAFLYMPFMHSEELKVQQEGVQLFQSAKLKDNVRFARHHCEIIRRFGRFPHRNAHLGRVSTKEELEWLNSDEGWIG